MSLKNGKTRIGMAKLSLSFVNASKNAERRIHVTTNVKLFISNKLIKFKRPRREKTTTCETISARVPSSDFFENKYTRLPYLEPIREANESPIPTVITPLKSEI